MSASKRKGTDAENAVVTYFQSRVGGRLGQRIAAAIEVSQDGCWLWLGRLGHKGYAQMRVGNARPMAHRVVYEAIVGPIPEGLQLDHLCRVRHCVNPDHLEPVTNQENCLRGETIPAQWAARTHCNNGHEFTAENTYQRKGGGRVCAECTRFRMKAQRARKASA